MGRIRYLLGTAALASATVMTLAAPAGATGPFDSPQAVVSTVDCGGSDVTIATLVPRSAEGSDKFGRGGIGHIADSTNKQIAQGIRGEFYDGATLLFVDEQHWGSEKATLECSFTVPLGGTLRVDVTVFYFRTPQG